MLRLCLRNVVAHKLRFLITTFAVVMGVGFVVGSLVVTDTLRRSVDGLFTEITAGVDVSVRAGTNISASQTSKRGRVPSDLVGTVRAVDGVSNAEGSVTGYAQLVDLQGHPVTTTGAPFIGVSWGHAAELRPATMGSGRAPVGAGEVAIDRGTADSYGIKVGDRTTVLLADGTSPPVTIVGIFTFGEANNLLGARLTAFDVDVAPRILGQAGQYDSIDVAAAKGIDNAALAARIQDVLPAGVESVTGAQVVTESSQGVSGLMNAFQNVLLGFAGIALFVSAFFINNTFSIVVGQRTRQLALLRSLGASPAQITRSVVGEALVVGLLASVVGIAFGAVIAVALQALLEGAGFGLPQQGLVLAGRTIAAAFIVGVGVTLASSIAPARRAATVPPVQGMTAGFVQAGWSTARRAWTAIGVAVLGTGLVVAGLFVADSTTAVMSLLAVGAVALFIGVTMLSPVAAVPLAGIIGRSIAARFGTVGRLAHANAIRNPDRTAKTASALMIGLALVTTVFIVGTSMKDTFSASIRSAVSADLVLSTGTSTGFSPALTSAVAKVPGVRAASGVRLSRFVFDGHERDLVAVDAAALPDLFDIDVRSGSFTGLGSGGIFIHEDPARDLGLAVGDHVTVEFATGGPRDLIVAGTYADSTYAGNYLIDMGLFTAHYPTSDLDYLGFARLAPGADAAATRTAVEGLLADYPQVKVENRAEFQAEQTAQFNSILIAVNGLLGLALFIALLGIANTLALSVLERTREIGLMRAVGMLRRQAREMVVIESAMVSIFGALLGIVVGLGLGVAVATAMPDSVVAGATIPWATLALIIGLAAVCGVGAGLVPARRAARLDVLRAMATD
jgi:putative ABC transport system permease protein